MKSVAFLALVASFALVGCGADVSEDDAREKQEQMKSATEELTGQSMEEIRENDRD
jgi:transcription initiation factor IIE alpha subunit